MSQINDDISILFYPNPVKDILTFSFKNSASKTHSILFYNLNGEIIFTTNSNKGQINMSHLASGIYILSCLNNDGIFHQKIIKQ